jgi:S1-C subfamily serine protease
LTFLDFAIVAVAISAVAGGFRLGLVTGATAWILLAEGLVAATIFLPGLDNQVKDLSPGVALAIEIGVFIGAGYAGVYAGRWMGTQFTRAFVDQRYAAADHVAGAIAAPIAVVLSVWLLVVPALSQTTGWLAGQTRRSLIARAIDDVLPPAPDTSRAFHRLIGPAGEPQVFASLDPFLDNVPPPATSGLDEATTARVAGSTVRVDGESCDRTLHGSGFTVAADTVVTNAHVVAGEAQTSVLRPDGARKAAAVTVFDPDRDLAVLHVAGLEEAALPIGDPETRVQGAVFGYPGGQADVKVTPAFVRRRLSARGADLYNDHETRRDVLILAADLQHGDSGGPLVNANGDVVGVSFASSLDRADTSYALSTSELRPLLAVPHTAAVSTGDCVG